MSSRLVCLAVLTVLVQVTAASAVAPPPAKGPTPAQIARWIEQLGDGNFNVRREASLRLRQAGEAAEEALEKASAHEDLEVRRRANELLSDFRWGIYPDTPEPVLKLIRRYQTVNINDKPPIIRALLAQGASGWRALKRITQREEDPRVRKDVFAVIAADLNRAAPALLEAGDLSALEPLLEMGLAGDLHSAISNFTVYQVLRGRLDAEIKHQEALARKKPPGKIQAEILVYLYRARGDLAAALEAAKRAERNDLQEAVLYEAADWKTLAARPELMGTTHPLEKLGLRAAYARLSGDRPGFLAAIKELRSRSEEASRREDPGPTPLHAAKILFLNGLPAEALEELARGREFDNERLEILLARYDLTGARKLMETARKEKYRDLDRLEIIWARALYNLGEKDEAVKLFKAQGDRIKKDVEFLWVEDLIDAEYRSRLDDLAFEHVTRILNVSEGSALAPRLFNKLFPDQLEEAMTLWRFLRTNSVKSRLEQIRTLLTGKATPKELAALKARLEKSPDLKGPQGPAVWLALGEASRLSAQAELARQCWEKADSSAARIRLGDLAAQKKDWNKAANHYFEGYRLGTRQAAARPAPGEPEEPDEVVLAFEDHSLPILALSLSGLALEKAGQKEAARKRLEQARWLPLGNAEVRSELARNLLKRGLLEPARRENDLLRRTAEPALHEPASLITAESLRLLAIDATLRKDYQLAATAYEQAALRCLRPEIRFNRPTAYLAIPASIQRNRAEVLASAGKWEEALAEVQLALALQPAMIDFGIEWVNRLEKAGRKKDADRIYQQMQAAEEGVVKDFPRCPWAWNSLAWVSACCRRDLEKGVIHARKAVELAPTSGAHHDTLAEVLFQLGRKEEAIAAQKKAIDLDPKRTYFRRQLKRIEAGDPKTERPRDEEE